MLAEYRGYSGLPGAPTEQGLYADARAYLEFLKAQGIESRHIVLYGHSLGTGVATEMATEFPVGGLMLLAPYLSIPKMAQIDFPIFPASLLVLDRFENYKKMKNIHTPLLIVNGSADRVIPAAQGRELYALANDPKEFRSIPERGHYDLFDDFVPLSMDWMSRSASPAPGTPN